VDDEEVLVDQAGHGGEGGEGRRAAGEEDVLAAAALEGGELGGDVALEDSPVAGGLQGPGQHHLGHALEQRGELAVGGGELGGVVGDLAGGHLVPPGHDGLVGPPTEGPGVGGPEPPVDPGHLLLAPRERLPEGPVGVGDAVVQGGLHVHDDLAHRLRSG
jgi:hypothetical protein